MQPERVALLLAAGFSRRYGSDKRLAGSPPLILRTLATLLPCHDSVLVVLRQRDETLRRLLANSGAELTQVPRDGGLGDSLAHGVRTLLASERVDEAMARFDQLERRVDYAEGRADALSLADQSSKPSLADEINALAGQDKIDEELEAMKRALKGDDKEG